MVATSLGILLPTPGPAQSRGVTIRGRVELPRPAPLTERRPSSGDLGDGPVRDIVEHRRAVVYFETAPKGAFEDRESGRVSMDQRHETFVPHLLAITVGTTVDFPNSDRTYHNVFSLSKTRSFDLGRYAAGHSKAILFDRPGIVRVFCDIHSHMSAFILVFAHRYFAVTDEEGKYHIDNVPPGSYNVVAWNEAMALDSRRAAIPEGGGDIELSFLFEKR